MGVLLGLHNGAFEFASQLSKLLLEIEKPDVSKLPQANSSSPSGNKVWDTKDFDQFLDANRPKLISFCAPIYWYDLSKPREDRTIHGGTCFFLALDDNRHVLVTAKHVAEELLLKQEKLGENCQCQVGSLVMEKPSFKLHPDVDVAITELLGDSMSILDKVPITFASIAPDVLEHSHVMLCGYPGKFREIDGKAIDFFIQIYAFHVSASYEDQFILQSHMDEEVADKFRTGTNKEDLDTTELKTASMGGISGGPVFQMVKKDEKEGEFEYRLSGMVTEQQQTLGQFIGANSGN